MSQLRRLLPSPDFRARIWFLLLAAAGLAAPGRGAIDAGITQAIWKMKFQVSDAQLYLNGDPAQGPNTAWLNADDDGDGISNGAEIAAGTDPFSANSMIKISSLSADGSGVHLTFPTVANKQYYVQQTTTLGNPASWAFVQDPNNAPQLINVVSTDGTPKMLTAPQTANAFYRILAQDLDTDGDGVSDWAEAIAGYDKTTTHTKNSPTDDHTAMLAAVATSNLITVSVTGSAATQPADSATPPIQTGSITINRSGPLTFSTITVPLGKSGTATEGMDYDALPASVSFGPGGTTVGATPRTAWVLTVNPRANASLKTNVTAIVKAMSGGGYSLGSPASGSVVINPAGNATGTGLSAAYYQGASSTYTSNVNFSQGSVLYTYASGTATITASGFLGGAQVNLQFASGPLGGGTFNTIYTIASAAGTTFNVPITGNPASGSGTCTLNPAVLSRTDPTVDFSTYNASTNPTGWGAGSNGTNGTLNPITTADAKYCVRWTGQVLPQYSETYYFDFRSDDGAKVWVDGKLLIDKWNSQGVTDWTNFISLKAGVLYDIQIDHFNGGGSGEAHLYWWSPSQPKQIIPQSRLYPAPNQPNKVTPLTNALTATGYVRTPFSLNVTTPNIGGSMTYSLASGSAPLPPGLTLDANTGIISGTPTTAGAYNVAINSQNSAASGITGSSVVNITIYPVGSVTREILAAGGSKVSDIVIPSGTPTHDTIQTIDDDVDYSTNTGERLRGYLIPPKTGNYYFWLAANNVAELWISNDGESVNKVRRAYVTASTGKKTWAAVPAQPSQQTPWLSLTAGQKYYFEVLHNSGADADSYVAVGWCQDDVGTALSTASSPNPTGLTPVIPTGGGALQGYPLSGTVPGFIFQPYDYPAVTAATGTLYTAGLGPQGASTTTASGSANLRVDASGTFATLHFSYGGLGSPRTAYHLHTDAFNTHTQGEIIYDIDDVDSFHPELKTADGGYIWNFGATGTFTSAAQILDAIQRGKVYLNIHTVTYPSGEIRGNLVLVDGSQTAPNPSLYAEPTPTDVASNDANAARFLNQASFGASTTDVSYVETNGFAGWITNQLGQPASHAADEVVANVTSDVNAPYPSSLFTNSWWKHSISGPDQLRQRLAFALSEIMVVSYNNDTGPLSTNGRILADYYDQLVDYCLPTTNLQDSGTFRGLLKAVTLTPAMGLYLDMLANKKGDDTIGRHPNENYAREIMQLFSVGLNRMWDDGKLVLDSNANLVPTYQQPTILGMAALMTGWNYQQALQANGRLPTNFSPSADYLNPMTLVPTQHDLNSKLLLDNAISPPATGLTPHVAITSISTGTSCTVTTSTAHGLKTGDTVTISGVSGGSFGSAINGAFQVTFASPTSFTVPVSCTAAPTTLGSVTGANVVAVAFGTSGISPVTGSQSDNTGSTLPHPYDQYGLNEVDRAIDNIVNNSNVPPFICRELIQRLVTSTPSSGYLYRVVQKFKDNGSGVRGDMVAVIKQILLDGEARSTPNPTDTAKMAVGRQREPVMRLTGPARAFPATAYSGTYSQLTGLNSNKLRIVTSTPNDFNAGFTVSLDFHNQNPPNPDPSNNPTSTSYAVLTTLGIASTSTGISSIATGSQCTITSTQAHGLANGNTVTISGVTGGTFSPSINGTFAVSNVNVAAASFTVQSNCTVVPTSVASAKFVSNPCKVTTVQAHGLTTGNTVTISGVSGGTFSPTINSSYPVIFVSSTSFTVPVNCTADSTSLSSAQVVGANTLDVGATGMVNASYSQVAGNSFATVNTAGPQTDVTVPGTSTTIKSEVYLNFLTQTNGSASLPTSGIFNVQTVNGTTSFTVNMPDTLARSGYVLIPKIPTSYSLLSSNTIVQYNNNVNHNMQVGDHFWVDVPVVNTPVTDAEFSITTTVLPGVFDEDHFTASYVPFNQNGGTYTKPSGPNNGVTIWPLVPPPLGRSGNVKVNQSTFSLGSTDSTLAQSPLNSPTVFNFYFPSYRYPGTLESNHVDSPEFQLTTDTNVVNLTNTVVNMFIGTGGANSNLNGLSSYNNGGGGVVVDIGPYMTAALTSESGISGLIDTLANILAGAPLLPATKTEILNFVNHKSGSPAVLDYLPYTTPTNQQMRDRVRAVIHLIVTSAEYATQK